MVSTVDLNTVDGLSEQEAYGLPSATAIARLKDEGYSKLPSARSRSILSFAWETVQDPIFLLLVGGGIIYWILGNLQEALILLGFVFFITGISLYQEGKIIPGLVWLLYRMALVGVTIGAANRIPFS